jgi:predicted CXXCH cytochrome family protein
LFLGRQLSSTHRQLENNCYACHTPWKGVFNESCAATDCHPEIENTIHNTMDRTCISCHVEHTDGAPLSVAMDNPECIQCHERMAADPESALHPQRLQSRQLTFVPRQTFRHAGHAPKPKCWECHCNGKDTINVDTKDLFKMKSCLVSGCHDQKQAECKHCHPLFHEQRSASLLTAPSTCNGRPTSAN